MAVTRLNLSVLSVIVGCLALFWYIPENGKISISLLAAFQHGSNKLTSAVGQNEILRIFQIQIPGVDFDIACKCSAENETWEQEISLPNQENIAGNGNGKVMQFGIDNKYKGAKDFTFQGQSNTLDQQNLLGVAKDLPKFARTQKQFIFQVRGNNHI